jgi:arylsulfatase A-like enzyme
MPHLPPASFAGTHQRSSIEPWASFSDSLEGKPAIVRRQRRDFYRNLPGSWDKWREIIGLYYDFTSYIDKEIGRILAALEEAGLDGNTVVIFTADHGDMQGCHNESVDKGFLYQEAVRIPLVFRGPGIPAGKVTDDFAYNMDILPTILDLAGSETRSETGSGIVTSAEPAAEKRDGKSLVPVLAGEGSVRENVYLEFHGLRFLYSQRALIDGEGRKYILSAGDFDEVYDLGKDPAELHNLIDDPGSSDIVEELRTAMMKEALAAGDPIVDYIYKIFGTWDNPSGRVWIPETVPTQQEQEGR